MVTVPWIRSASVGAGLSSGSCVVVPPVKIPKLHPRHRSPPGSSVTPLSKYHGGRSRPRVASHPAAIEFGAADLGNPTRGSAAAPGRSERSLFNVASPSRSLRTSPSRTLARLERRRMGHTHPGTGLSGHPLEELSTGRSAPTRQTPCQRGGHNPQAAFPDLAKRLQCGVRGALRGLMRPACPRPPSAVTGDLWIDARSARGLRAARVTHRLPGCPVVDEGVACGGAPRRCPGGP